MAATGALALVATTEKPEGAADTKSPWLAQTRTSDGTPAKSGASGERDRGMAELALRRGRNRAAERVRHQLHAVADAKHRRPDAEDRGLALRRAGVRHALGTTRENHADRFSRANLLRGRIRRPDFRVDREFSKTTSDQLCVL